MAKGPTRGWRLAAGTALAALAGNQIVAQESVLVGLRGDLNAVRAALAAMPPEPAADVIGAVVDLLRRTDAPVRNEAMAWLMAHPKVGAAALPAVEALRRSDDPDTARAAAAVGAALRRDRAPALAEMKIDLARPDTQQSILARIQQSPDLGWELLPELLAIQYLQNAEPALARLRAADPARLRAGLLQALRGPCDARGIADQLALSGDFDAASVGALDAVLEHADQRARERAAEVLTGWVAGGAPPPSRWLALLRSLGTTSERGALFRELDKHLLPASLHGELGQLLADPGLHGPAELLLRLGSDAMTFVPALRTALATRDTYARAALAYCVADLAPATRDCIPLLLPCLAEAHQQAVLPALLALVEFGDLGAGVLEAVTACLDHPLAEVRLDALAALGALRATDAAERIRNATAGAPEAFTTLATFVLASFTPEGLPTAELLRELDGTDPHRRLVAASLLRSRTVSSTQILERLQLAEQSREWVAFTYRRSTDGLLVRNLVADRAPDQSAGTITGWGSTYRNQARICHWLAADLEHGVAGLRRRLQGAPHEQLFLLQALAARGRAAGQWTTSVGPFVHHPEQALRDAATTCLRAIAGDDAIAAARATANPWPDWLALSQGTGRTVDPTAFARDTTKPKWMRAVALRRVGVSMGRPKEPGAPVDLVALLVDDDDELAAAAAHLHRRLRASVAKDSTALQAFAGGSAAVRTSLGAAARTECELPWPMPATLAMLARPEAAEAVSPDGRMLFDSSSLAALALEQMRRHRLRPPAAWALQQLAIRPNVALWLLHGLPGPPEAELLPKLTALAARPTFAPVVVGLLTRAGVAVPASAAAAAKPAGPELVQALLAGAQQPPEMRRQLELARLVALPWKERPDDLAAECDRAAALWHEAPRHERQAMLGLLLAMGPLAGFAADDLAVEMANRPERFPGQFAETLVAIGHADKVRAWLRRLPIESPPQGLGPTSTDLVREVWAARLAAKLVEATDAEVAALSAALSPHHAGLTAADRDGVFLRLLAHTEANAGNVNYQLPLLQPLGELARAGVAAFFARRRALPQRPDVLADLVARVTFPALPDLVLGAMRDGVVRFECLQFVDVRASKAAIRAIADELVEAVAASRERVSHVSVRTAGPDETDPNLGQIVGCVLLQAGAVPVARLLECLAEPASRQFALATLSALGPAASAATGPVAALAEQPREPHRIRAAHVLARLGSTGVQRLCMCVDRDPSLQPALTFAVTQGDDASRAEVARWLGLMRRPDTRPLVEVLEDHLERTVDEHARVTIVLALLQYDFRPTQRDWLAVPNWRNAVIRRRLVDGLAVHARDLMAWGVLAELLGDEDAGVQAAAATALLAAPERIAACRRPLAEFASTAPAELAARIRAALAK